MNFKDFIITKPSDSDLWKEQIEKRTILKEINLKFWLENNFVSLGWLFLLIIIILFYFIWLKLVDKTRLMEIVLYGLMVSCVALIIDLIGNYLVLWGYPNKIFPMIPPIPTVSLCILPVLYMLMYQYFPDWKSFTLASIILAFLIAFIAGPIAVRLEFYQLNNWKYLYSSPIYLVMAISLK